MGKRGRDVLVGAIAAAALSLGMLGSNPVLAAEAEPPPADVTEEQGPPEDLVEAVGTDLGMSWEEFVSAGTQVEEAEAQLEGQGSGTVAVLSQEGVSLQTAASLGEEGGESSTFADLEELREAYVREVGTGGLSGLVITLEGYEVLVADPEEATDRGREDAESPLVSPAEWGAAHGVAVTATSGEPTPAATVLGGSAVTFGGAACTHGFNGWYRGRQTGISAGHCVIIGGREVRLGGSVLGTSDWWQFGAPGSGWETYGTDFATYPLGSGWNAPATIRSGGGSLTITGRAAAVVGMPVCKQGRVTGWTCSRVNKIGWQWIGDGSGDFNRPKRWVWSLFADTRVIPGDSGGPWVTGHKAVGVTSSYDNYADGSPYATASLLTSLDEYRPGAQPKVWLGRATLPSATFSDTTTARARWADGETVSGRLTRLSGDSVSAGTVVEVRVNGTRVASPKASADGSFSFVYPGSDSRTNTVTFQARSGDSLGPVVTVKDQPAGIAPKVVRYAGQNRYETAARIATTSWKTAGTVVVASGENFPDALSGGAYAGGQGAPVVLTKRWSLPSATAEALATLRPTRIVVVGGSSAVSWQVQRELAAVAPVTRFSGANRYEVAARVAGTYDSPDTVFVASGEGFADALTAAARAGGTKMPLLLTKKDGLPSVVEAELRRLDPRRIIVLGGTGAVSSSVATRLESFASTVVRLDGSDRYAVAARLARLYPIPSSPVWLARGDQFADALASAPAAAKNGVPVLLTRPDGLSSVTESSLHRLSPARIHVAGGTGSVSAKVVDQLRWLTFR